MQVKFFEIILAIIFWQFTVFLWKFDSPQVKRDSISSRINFVYTFSQEFCSGLWITEVGMSINTATCFVVACLFHHFKNITSYIKTKKYAH